MSNSPVSFDTVESPIPTPYTPVIIADPTRALAFISGQLPLDATTGEIEATDVGGQTHASMSNAMKLVASLGAGAADIVKVVVFTTDLGEADIINRTYLGALGDARPARSMVEVSRLPKNAKVEIEMVVSVPLR